MPNFRHVDTTANAVVFANPNRITDTLRVNVKLSPKNVNGTKLQNARSEIKTHSTVPVSMGDVVIGDEIIAISTSISGSLENKEIVAQKVRVHIAALQLVLDDLVGGWKPQADVVIPVDFIPVEE